MSKKILQQTLDAAEGVGLSRSELMSALGPAASSAHAFECDMDWNQFVLVLERLSDLLDGDAVRIRQVGRALVRAPSYEFLRRVARTVVSLRGVYEAGARWLAPASFPHLPLEQTFLAGDRLHVRGAIPEPYAPSAAFFHVFEGILIELPTYLGLPRATLVRSVVSPRSIEAVVQLPPSRSLFGRARRALRSVVRHGEVRELFEQQRKEIADRFESIQRSSNEIQDLFDRLPDLVIIHRAGTILWKNRAVVKTLGYELHDDLVGRPLLDVVAPVSRDAVRARMTGVGDGSLPDLMESCLLTRDGRIVLVEVSPSQIVSFGGEPARLVVGRDVSERVRLQQELRAADRMASIGMLAAGVAHEVNNPLAYVLNNVEMAMKALAPLGATTQQSRDALAVALEGVAHIRTIVRDLLVLSRTDDQPVGPVDVRVVVESTLALAAKRIWDRAELTTEYHAAPLARGTASRLGQVLLNLLSNAVEAMPESTRETNRLHVVVRTDEAGRAMVSVADNGIGIPPENAARIFDPFFTTKPLGSGTGLGLAISQRLLAEIGGELSFESAPHRGSTFFITLPAAETDLEAVQPSRRAATTSTTT